MRDNINAINQPFLEKKDEALNNTIDLLKKKIEECDNFKIPNFWPENDYGAELETNKKINNQIIENFELLKDIKDNPEKYSDDLEIKEFLKELPYNPWSKDFIRSLDMKKYKALLKVFASKRLFGHNFPRISLENSYICNGVYNKGVGFKQVRDKGPAINFTCEHEYGMGLYGGADGGHVIFPAEVILSNFSFVRLPYETHRDEYYNEYYEATTEFRCYGKETDDKEEDNNLNKIDLDLGILLLEEGKDYSDIDLKKYNGRIIYYNNYKEGETIGDVLKEFIKDIEFEKLDRTKLPKILSPINTNDTYESNGFEVNLISTEESKQKKNS